MTLDNFINENIDLIDQNRWEELYKKLFFNQISKAGKLTDMLLATGIDPLSDKDLRSVPICYLKNSNLEELIIPEHINTIRYGAFYRSNLSKVILPKSITKIEQNAFMTLGVDCDIIYNGTVEEFDKIEIEYPGQFGGNKVNCSDGIWEFN